MKRLILALCVVAFGVNAQTPVWPPSTGRAEVPIWPGAAPDAQPVNGPENKITVAKDSLVDGRPVIAVENVARPTMTVYAPAGNNTGAAVVVFPGGGYKILAIDLDERCKCHIVPKAPTALEDAQRTVGLVRFHAREWHIDPHKIGVLGFSAGGHMVAAMSTHFEHRLYAAVDAADKESCRPDFAVALYPGHLWTGDGKFELNPDIRTHITRQTPPTFLLQAENDYVDNVNQSLVYYIALKNAKVPVEMHLYAQGGHAFGLRRTKLPITGWPRLVEIWLGSIGMLPE